MRTFLLLDKYYILGDVMEVLKLNSKGTLVEYLQSLLSTLGFGNPTVDGIFGKETEKSVINFQRNFFLTPDGIVGSNTWNKLFTFSYIVPTNVSYGYNILSINLDGFKKRYPFLNFGSIGYSNLGRTIPYIRFGTGRKQVFYSASIHANEYITSILLMKYIENLSEAYLNNSTIYDYRARFLFDNVSLFIVPMVNPDGVDLVVGNIQKYLPQIYDYAKVLSTNYPTIPFPSGWKANIRGVNFKKIQLLFHTILLCSLFSLIISSILINSSKLCLLIEVGFEKLKYI